MSGNRIPADKSSRFTSWDIPEVQKGLIVQAEKLKQRGPRGELVALDNEEVIYSSITARQLEEISAAAYEDVYQQAYQDGLKKGHDEGYRAGREAGEQEARQYAEGLRGAIDNLMRLLNDQDDEVEQALVNLATCIASSILRRELTIDSSQILAVVDEAVQSLPVNARNITVHLSEQDLQWLQQRDDIPEQWKLQVDRTLSPGGCRVTTSQSVVDYTLEDQFQELVNALVEKRFAELAGRAKNPSVRDGE